VNGCSVVLGEFSSQDAQTSDNSFENQLLLKTEWRVLYGVTVGRIVQYCTVLVGEVKNLNGPKPTVSNNNWYTF